YQLENYCGL
nr:Chain E, Insulin derived 9-mer peptide [synthetic construct]3WS3_F Chain F, Insulin derived 9-mer peptide [synthetic construct]